ncbi:MAG: glycoside hydrolase [Bacteroidaceae bacterium]|nr:glycoside hydrolase [Bacteroidaceae bacterium]
MMKKKIVLLTFSLIFVLSTFAQSPRQTTDIRTITVDLNQPVTPLNTMYNFCVGAGRAHEGLYANWQEQLRIAKQACGFRYIRFHGLLHDDMGVYKWIDGKPQYNFQYIDALYDFLLSINVRPFVELSFMPDALKSNDKTVFWWKGNISQPSDTLQYKNLIKALVQHFTERYGQEEVKKWYFEVWNEPNLLGFFDGTQQDYFNLYQWTSETIKSVCPDYRVGGPATAGNAWITDFLQYTNKHHLPVDFVSTHTYGVQGFLDEFGKDKLHLIENPDCMAEDVQHTRQAMIKEGKSTMELHYTEFNSSYSPRDPFHDTYQNATYILNTLKKSGKATTSMSYWTFTDIFEEAGTVDQPFHGGFGLINWQGILKPTFYAYSFLNKLYPNQLATADQSSWVTKDDKGNIAALIYDFTMPNQGKKSDQAFYIQLQPAQEKGKISFAINHINNGKYELQITSIGYKQHDALSAYIDMGSPSQLSLQQEQTLKQQSIAKPEKSVVNVTKQNYSLQLDWKSNQMYLVKLIRLTK